MSQHTLEKCSLNETSKVKLPLISGPQNDVVMLFEGHSYPRHIQLLITGKKKQEKS